MPAVSERQPDAFPRVILVNLICGDNLFEWCTNTSMSASEDARVRASSLHVEVASVTDAIEQMAGKKTYMTHRMRPIFSTRLAGYALTVSLQKEANHDPDALKGMLHAIDTGGPNSVYVMVVEDGNDIAGMGGLMGTAMAARNFSGAVI